MTESKAKTTQFSREKLKKEFMREAKAINLQAGAAAAIAEKTLDKAEKWAKERGLFTPEDLDRVIAKEVEKYNSDLAYVYKNRGKII